MSHLGTSWELEVVEAMGEKAEATRFDVGFGYLETLGLRLQQGRFLADWCSRRR